MKDDEKENRFIRFTLHTSGNVKFLNRSTSIFLNIIREPLDFVSNYAISTVISSSAVTWRISTFSLFFYRGLFSLPTEIMYDMIHAPMKSSFANSLSGGLG